MNTNISNQFGYCEMYEWNETPENNNDKFGYFVQFNKTNPDKIERANTISHAFGVSSANSITISDNPVRWPEKYVYNNVGDPFITKISKIKSNISYDTDLNLTYVSTYKDDNYIPVINENYNDNIQYVQRVNRIEWVSVTLLGKVIVHDTGECIVGDYCKPYNGTDKRYFGYAVPASIKDKTKYYVMKRISDESIVILFK